MGLNNFDTFLRADNETCEETTSLKKYITSQMAIFHGMNSLPLLPDLLPLPPLRPPLNPPPICLFRHTLASRNHKHTRRPPTNKNQTHLTSPLDALFQSHPRLIAQQTPRLGNTHIPLSTSIINHATTKPGVYSHSPTSPLSRIPRPPRQSLGQSDLPGRRVSKLLPDT
jgi:hypothetical protein